MPKLRKLKVFMPDAFVYGTNIREMSAASDVCVRMWLWALLPDLIKMYE